MLIYVPAITRVLREAAKRRVMARRDRATAKRARWPLYPDEEARPRRRFNIPRRKV